MTPHCSRALFSCLFLLFSLSGPVARLYAIRDSSFLLESVAAESRFITDAIALDREIVTLQSGEAPSVGN